ncbi:MAG: DUF853 family protein [Hyphomicrobiaceae bacterium]|nr:MAG: DUF853 family protein [Hyphomicrobiaceae bacterium]
MANRADDRNSSAPAQREDYNYASPTPRRGYQRQSVGEAAMKSFIRAIAASLGRIIVRAITGRMR